MINTKNPSYHLLRVGIGITFLWIGVMIFREPEFWGGFLQPWAVKLLPFSLTETIPTIAILDILIGFFLLIDFYVWMAAILVSIHLIIILIVTGVDAVTVRDIGLLGAGISLFWSDLPEKIKIKFKKTQKMVVLNSKKKK